MISAIGRDRYEARTVIIGLSLLCIGLVSNYLLERHNIFKLLEQSPYPVSWADLFYPPLCVFLCIAGFVLLVSVRWGRWPAFAIAIPATVLYTLFFLAMQFVQTGADRLGECPGLMQAAVQSNVIPESKSLTAHPAVFCGVERRGISMGFYNHMTVYGVSDSVSQKHVLDRVAEHYRQARTHPVEVLFYESENWSVRYGKNGTTFGSRGPEKLIRVANIG